MGQDERFPGAVHVLMRTSCLCTRGWGCLGMSSLPPPGANCWRSCEQGNAAGHWPRPGLGTCALLVLIYPNGNKKINFDL